MQVFEAPAVLDEIAREPVEQLRMSAVHPQRRSRWASPRCPAEVPAPDAVDQHRRQRVLRRRSASAASFGGVGRRPRRQSRTCSRRSLETRESRLDRLAQACSARRDGVDGLPAAVARWNRWKPVLSSSSTVQRGSWSFLREWGVRKQTVNSLDARFSRTLSGRADRWRRTPPATRNNLSG